MLRLLALDNFLEKKQQYDVLKNEYDAAVERDDLDAGKISVLCLL